MVSSRFIRFGWIVLIAGAFVFYSVPSLADIYVQKSESGAIKLTDQRVDDSYQLILKSKIPDDYEIPSLEQLQHTIEAAAERFDIPKTLIYAVVTVESNGKKDAESEKGAIGLMQLMPGTALDMGVEDPYDPRQNIMGGTKYLQKMLNRYDGNLSLALAGNNAGPGHVDK